MRATRRWIPALALLAAALACTDENPNIADLAFQGEQQALPGFSHDTGFQPAGGPIQVRFVVTNKGKLVGHARGSISDTGLVGIAGTGSYILDTRVSIKAYLKLNLAGKKFNGPLPHAPAMELDFTNKASFDPFLIGQRVTAKHSFPDTRLATVNLAGALTMLPGIKGDLVVSAAGTVTSDFTGACARVSGDLAQYTANTATSGSLTLKPSVEVRLPLGVSKKLAPFEIKVPLPTSTAAMDLGTRSISGGAVSGKGPCSGGGVTDGGVKDGAPPPTDGAPADAPRDGPPGDVGPQDGPPAEGTCTKGTPDNCAFCGDTCPGPDDSATARACVSGTCTIACKGDNYDVNGKIADGCEVADPLAKHTTEATAKDLGAVSDCDPVKKAAGTLLSDSRHHVTPPNDREQGGYYWFKLAITDKTWCALSASATVSFAALPKAAKYSVMAHYVCKKDGKKLPATSKSANGGKSLTLNPKNDCKGSDDGGTLFLRIHKATGKKAHSSAKHQI